MADRQKPGSEPAKPGEYIERGPRGGHVDNARQVTIDGQDGHLPPTQEPGNTWERIGPPKK